MMTEEQRAEFEAEMDAIDAEVEAEYAGLSNQEAAARLCEEVRAYAMSHPVTALQYTMINRAFDDPSRVESLVEEIHETVRRNGSLEMRVAASVLVPSLRQIAAYYVARKLQ